VDEAVDTFKKTLENYELRDEKAMNMHYWLGRALEQKGDRTAALRSYSQVAQLDFNFRDVQKRIKELRNQPQPPQQQPPQPVS
jgi:TolA-binding protein